MKVARRVSDIVYLPLEVSALANEYKSVRVDRVAVDKFELKAWSKLRDAIASVTLSSNALTTTPNTIITLSGSVSNYSGASVPDRDVNILESLDNSVDPIFTTRTDSSGSYSALLTLPRLGKHTLVSECSKVLSREIQVDVLRNVRKPNHKPKLERKDVR